MKTFMNISNHPSAKWSNEQVEGVAELGYKEIDDLLFPNVSPSATTEEIEELAESMVSTISCWSEEMGVFIAGEYTLVVALLCEFQKRGISCYTATTNRVVKETVQPDGSTKKDVEFRFVQWRKFPLLVKPKCDHLCVQVDIGHQERTEECTLCGEVFG